MGRRIRSRHYTVIQLRAFVMRGSDSPAPGQTRIQQAGRPAMKVHKRVKPTDEEPRARRTLPVRNQDFIEIGIAVKAGRKSSFHKHRDAEGRKFFLQGADRSGEKETVSHRAETYKEDASLGGKSMKKVFSLQLSLR